VKSDCVLHQNALLAFSFNLEFMFINRKIYFAGLRKDTVNYPSHIDLFI
jgi:hypothetical protein